MAEEFDESTREFTSASIGAEERADPAIVSTQTAASGGDRAVEGADLICLAHGGDDVLILRNAEAGVATVGGIDEGLKKGLTDFLV